MARKKPTRNLLALVISRVFDPMIEIPILLFLAVYLAISNGLRWRFFVFLVGVDAMLPALYLFYGLRKGFISDWDVTNRKERYGLYFFTVMAHLFGVMTAYFLGKQELFELLLVFWTLAVVFALTTAIWKISVHAGTNAAMLAVFNHYYGWDKYWWLVIVLGLVGWSRVVMKKHSWAQVLVGSALSLSWVTMGLVLFD